MTRSGLVLTCALLAAAAPASGARPTVALTATPAHVRLAGSGLAAITVTNPGRARVVVDVTRAGFSLDLRGRPRILAAGGTRGARSWLSVRPHRLALGAGESASLLVTARPTAAAEPGDHDALVLLTTRPQAAAGVGVRMRIGVVVVVRAPGAIVHRLELRGLTVRRSGEARIVELLLVNRGNVTESVGRGRLEVSLMRGGRVEARLSPGRRVLRPRSRGIVQLAYRGPLRGGLIAQVRIGSEVRRTFHIRL
jgi:hypothetical protein